MSAARVIIVHLRRPQRSDPSESRSDPYYEFGSFGCTKCHARNLMHPRRALELDVARFAFAQGGPLGFRLVYLSPPARVKAYRDRCELLWAPAEMPFRYDTAPVLVNAAGAEADPGSDFPMLVEKELRRVFRSTWPGRFSSAFRTRRRPLADLVAEEMVRVFDRKFAHARPGTLASSYVDALPCAPNKPDQCRKSRLARLRGEAQSCRSTGCRGRVRHAAN